MRLEKSVVINRPEEEVFAFVTDMHKVKLWMPIKDIQQISGEGVQKGATFSQTVEFMGQRFSGVMQLTEFDPPHTFAFKVIQGPFPLANRMVFTALGQQTNINLICDAEPGNALKIAGPLIGTIAKKQLETQLNTLKRLLEQ